MLADTALENTFQTLNQFLLEVNVMKKLKFHPASAVTELEWPSEIHATSLETPALHFFTDFREVKPLVIESSVSAVDVKNLMIKAHVRLKIVINERNEFLGIVSADDLSDRLIMQKVSEGQNRTDISVADMMQPKHKLVALGYKELKAITSIGDVIEALKDSGQQHCLVVDSEPEKIRGIFSASDISRMLHLPIDIQDRSSFYKVFSAIG